MLETPSPIAEAAMEGPAGAGREGALAERLDTAGGLPAVSEVERLFAQDGIRKAAIAPDWPGLLGEARRLGEVRSVARNAHAIHKSWGTYGALRGGGEVGLVINGGIDLRMFFGAWKHAYIVEAPCGDATQLSLQICDGTGDAVQKIFPETSAGMNVLREWAGRYGVSAGTPVVVPAPASSPERPDSAIDATALLTEWQGLKDVHHFRALLARHGAGRTQALRLARGRFAERVGNDALARILAGAHDHCVPLMVFLANRGIVQIHSGTIGACEHADGWLHLTDPEFHLHLREAGIAESWVVTKPTADGPVTSLELYDAAGETVLQLFGVRSEGMAENPAWQVLAHSMAVAS